MRFHPFRWPQRALGRVAALLPSACALCGACDEKALCRDCRARFFGAPCLRCVQCASPLAHETGTPVCGDCRTHPPAFDATIVAADYRAPVDQLVLGLKFGGRLALAPLCAGLLHDAWRRTDRGGGQPTCLIAVPLGSQRLVERGFNQSFEIARSLARMMGLPLERQLVQRPRDTVAQARLHPDERKRNMRGAFAVTPAGAARIRGLHIGVVDDVITTGHTLNELAATLKRFGAARVTNLVFARTLPK